MSKRGPVPSFVENVEWMASTGEVLPGIAHRLGVAEDSVKRGLLRYGRGDLVRRIDPHLNESFSRNQFIRRTA